MNSHHFGYEFGSNYVVGYENYHEDVHQGWNNQRWEEPQRIDHPSWQQPPPDSYGYNSHPNAYQSNGCGDPYCYSQQPPPYAYEPPPQYNFKLPYSQASYHQPPPYDPNPYPPYPPPYEPYEPYMEPPPFQHNYSQEPPQCTPSPYPYQEEPPSYYKPSLQNNEPSYPPQAPIDDSLTLLLQGQADMQRNTL